MTCKVVILIEPPDDPGLFEDRWPEFLHHVEALPGLRREATSRVDHYLFGPLPIFQMHELFFDSFPAAQAALASPAGQNAGRLLQAMTGGRMALFFADHKEDDLANIARYKQAPLGTE
jgi:hypothetical protein